MRGWFNSLEGSESIDPGQGKAPALSTRVPDDAEDLGHPPALPKSPVTSARDGFPDYGARFTDKETEVFQGELHTLSRVTQF